MASCALEEEFPEEGRFPYRPSEIKFGDFEAAEHVPEDLHCDCDPTISSGYDSESSSCRNSESSCR